MQIHRWWESIKHNPFDPWTNEDGSQNFEHWERPYGMYDSMTFSQRGDFFEPLCNANWFMYEQTEGPVFPELDGDDAQIDGIIQDLVAAPA